MIVGTGLACKTWYLPKELLVNASPFFAAALNGAFAEATSKTITLPEDDTDAFALFVRWLYVGKISGQLFNFEEETIKDAILGTWTGTSDDDVTNAYSMIYLKACILGDKLGCLIFLDLAMLELIQSHEFHQLTAETMRLVFTHFSAGSKIRRFAIDQFRWDLRNSWYDKNVAEFVSTAKITEDFALDFLKACIEAHGSNAADPCQQRRQYMEVLTLEEKTSTGTQSFIS